MDNNIYSPPHAVLKSEDSQPGSLKKAILIGAAIDIGGSLVLGVVVAVGYSFILGAQGHTPEEIAQLLTSSFMPLSPLGLMTMVLGLLISTVAGYQCASIVKRPGYQAPAILAVISVAFGFVMGMDMYSLWESIGMAALTVLAIFGGARLYQRRHPANV